MLRKVVKIKDGYRMTIPAEFMNYLGWEEGDKIFVLKQHGSWTPFLTKSNPMKCVNMENPDKLYAIITIKKRRHVTLPKEFKFQDRIPIYISCYAKYGDCIFIPEFF